MNRWSARLIPYHFTIEYVPGRRIGFADYLSRHPSFEAHPQSKFDKNYIVNWTRAFNTHLKEHNKRCNASSNWLLNDGKQNSNTARHTAVNQSKPNQLKGGASGKISTDFGNKQTKPRTTKNKHYIPDN